MLGTGAESNRSATRPQRYDGTSSRTTVLPSQQWESGHVREQTRCVSKKKECIDFRPPLGLGFNVCASYLASAAYTCRMPFGIFRREQLQ